MRLLVLLALMPLASPQTYDYQDALSKSLLFYEAQRSGPLPADNRIPFRGDSALDDVIVGGYYDAGDHCKLGFFLAGAFTQLSWGAVSFASGYEKAGQTPYIVESLQWATDYLVSAHKAPTEFVYQICDVDLDHNYWGRPEDMNMPRPALFLTEDNPGSHIAGETAAALAAASMFYNMVGDAEKATEALSHAEELFDFANNFRGQFRHALREVEPLQNEYSFYHDELAWAAAWLAKVTGNSSYLDLAETFYEEYHLNYVPIHGFYWDDKTAGVQILLWELTGDVKYLDAVDSFVDYMLNEVPRTPQGLLWLYYWGSLRHAGNVAHALLQVANLGHRADEIIPFAQSQIDYILGDTGLSYMIGFGDTFPGSEHHRAASCYDAPSICDWDNYYMTDPNPQILYGAVVGGPGINDNYTDVRDDYVGNEVALDYNAGIQSVLAFFSDLYF